MEGDPKAYDMSGNPVPWAAIFQENNTLDVVMETRGTVGTVKEAKLIGGTVK